MRQPCIINQQLHQLELLLENHLKMQQTQTGWQQMQVSNLDEAEETEVEEIKEIEAEKVEVKSQTLAF